MPAVPAVPAAATLPPLEAQLGCVAEMKELVDPARRSKRQAEARKKASGRLLFFFFSVCVCVCVSLAWRYTVGDVEADQAIAAVAAGSDDSARALIKEVRSKLIMTPSRVWGIMGL